MKNYALLMQYDGARFFGFQAQKNQVTVQGFLERVLEIFVRHPVRIHGAGRTDTGVHALGQVVHFESPDKLNLHALMGCINAYGRTQGISVLEIVPVPLDFHARFSAIAREYIYLIHTHAQPSILTKNRAYHVGGSLDVNLMKEAAQKLLGQHNFESFRSIRCQATHALRTLEICEIQKYNNYLMISLRARSFLHNQVRIMMGTLVSIGKGERPVAWIDKLLEIKDRTQSGITAPAHGLYFKNVDYGSHVFKTTPTLLMLG